MPKLGLPWRPSPQQAALVVAAVLTAAGGYVHLTEWATTYRHVPSAAPGAWVVRAGFPLHAAVSLVLALALLTSAFRRRRWGWLVISVAAMFQLGALVMVVATRTGRVLGWTEPTWTTAAEQSRALASAALISLAVAAVLGSARRKGRPTSIWPRHRASASVEVLQ